MSHEESDSVVAQLSKLESRVRNQDRILGYRGNDIVVLGIICTFRGCVRSPTKPSEGWEEVPFTSPVYTKIASNEVKINL